jgi:RNase P/RNase MRP subunit POP5
VEVEAVVVDLAIVAVALADLAAEAVVVAVLAVAGNAKHCQKNYSNNLSKK